MIPAFPGAGKLLLDCQIPAGVTWVRRRTFTLQQTLSDFCVHLIRVRGVWVEMISGGMTNVTGNYIRRTIRSPTLSDTDFPRINLRPPLRGDDWGEEERAKIRDTATGPVSDHGGWER